MVVDAKVFMELVEKQTRMELEMSLRMKQLETRLETLEKRPIALDDESDKKSSDAALKLYHEMTDGVKDEKAGRVIYTDGRD
jgi:DTW domain-containing protein YfiP